MHHGIVIIFALSHSDRVWVQTTGWETDGLLHVTRHCDWCSESKMEVRHLLTCWPADRPATPASLLPRPFLNINKPTKNRRRTSVHSAADQSDFYLVCHVAVTDRSVNSKRTVRLRHVGKKTLLWSLCLSLTNSHTQCLSAAGRRQTVFVVACRCISPVKGLN